MDQLEIQEQGYDNIEQLMRRVPGVYFRTEDGFGNFPNLSFRGVGSMRTTKLTVMEDGILSAPAPYANPAAYYIPATGRMSGVEILKGSSQVRYGPQTTGGVINYLSTPVPLEQSGKVRLSLGENGDYRAYLQYGEVWSGDGGELGMLLEWTYRRNDGFKRMDTSPDYSGGGTGFRRTEPMLKLSWSPEGDRRQRLEFKVGYSRLEADESYLGLSTSDFREDPYRRYVSTQFDRIPTEHWRTYLRHTFDLTRDSRVVSTLYYNRFDRAWYKLHEVRRIGGGVASLSEALAGAGFQDGGGAMPGTEGIPLAVLRGEAEGVWRVRDNNRSYQSYGLETALQYNRLGQEVSHRFELGLRLHADYEDRFQKQDDYRVDDRGRVVDTTVREPGTQDNRRGSALALAGYLRDEIHWERLTLVPGIRYERIWFKDTRRGMDIASPNFNQVTLVRRGTLDVVAPGIAGTYRLSEDWTAFGGVHRGFSLPGPGAVTSPSNPVQEETSIGFESGLRFRNVNGWNGEAVLFWTEFRNLIVPDNIGGAGTGVTENAGDVQTRGVELSLAYDPATRLDFDVRNPWHLAVTLTDATIRSDVRAGGGSGGAVESVFAGARKGNRLPYIPTWQLSIGSALEFARLTLRLDGFYSPSTYASANNGFEEINPVGGPGNTPVPDARFGRNDAYFLLDFSASYDLRDDLRLYLTAQNVLDRKYIASRLPHGPRPGHPRLLQAGLSWSF